MLRTKVKKAVDSTINHVKAHPVIYAYAAGATVGIVSMHFVTNHLIKDFLKDKKLIDLNDALKHLRDQGLSGLKYEMVDETFYLFPSSSLNFTQD